MQKMVKIACTEIMMILTLGSESFKVRKILCAGLRSNNV